MTLLVNMLLIAGGIGMIVGLMKSRQGYSWGTPLTIVCLIVTLPDVEAGMTDYSARSDILEEERAFAEEYYQHHQQLGSGDVHLPARLFDAAIDSASREPSAVVFLRPLPDDYAGMRLCPRDA